MYGSYSGSAIAPRKPVSSRDIPTLTYSTRATARSRPSSPTRMGASRRLSPSPRAPCAWTAAARLFSPLSGATRPLRASRVPCLAMCCSRRRGPRRPSPSVGGPSGAPFAAARSSYRPSNRRRSNDLLSYRPHVTKRGKGNKYCHAKGRFYSPETLARGDKIQRLLPDRLQGTMLFCEGRSVTARSVERGRALCRRRSWRPEWQSVGEGE